MALRIAIAGFGPRGRMWADIIGEVDGCEVVACAEPDDGVRAQHARPGLPALPSLEDALDEHRPDAVIVASTPQTHAILTRAALEAGAAVLVEKPFTLDLATAIELVELAEARDVALLVAHNLRYLRVQRSLRAAIRDGLIGEVRAVTFHHYRTDPPAHLGPGANDHEMVWDVGVHHVDALRDALGDEVSAVVAETFDDGGSVQAMLEFEGGTRVVYSSTRHSRGHERIDHGNETVARFTGTEGTLHMAHRRLVLFRPGQRPRMLRRPPRPVSEEHALLLDFLRAVRGEPVPGITGRDNLGTLSVADAFVRSAQERAWVDLAGAGVARA